MKRRQAIIGAAATGLIYGAGMKQTGALKAIFNPGWQHGSRAITAQLPGVPPPPVLTTLTIVGSVTGTQLNNAYACRVSGSHVFVANNNDNSVTAVNVSVPASPSIADSVKDNTVLSGAIDLALVGTHALVACQFGDRLAVVNISDPTNLSIDGDTGVQTNLDGALGVAAAGTLAYVTSANTNRLTIVDFSTPSSPTLVSGGSVQDNTNLNVPYGVAFDPVGEVCFVASNAGNRLTSVDVSTPSSPSVISSLNDSSQLNTPTRVRLNADASLAYVGTSDGLAIVDVSNPASMSVVGYYDANTLVAEACLWNGYPIFSLHSADKVAAADTSTTAPAFVDDTGTDSILDGAWGVDTDEATQYCYATARFADALVVIEIA